MSLDVSLYIGDECVFDANITHNLSAMAHEAGMYTALWYPDELLDPEAAKIADDAETEARELFVTDRAKCDALTEKAKIVRAQIPKPIAGDLAPIIEQGLALMKADPKRFEAHNATNGWGLYEHFVPWIERYLEACKQHPTAHVEVSR